VFCIFLFMFPPTTKLLVVTVNIFNRLDIFLQLAVFRHYSLVSALSVHYMQFIKFSVEIYICIYMNKICNK